MEVEEEIKPKEKGRRAVIALGKSKSPSQKNL